ncbi:MAG: ATP-dependent DNA ligase [candidate division KSB1 bacterium]|nr:ATP-dependent DNA ligase [candidate division KSB1 bacterium]
MPPTPFSTLAALCQQLEGTTKKLEKSALISGFLQKLQPEEIAPAVLLLLGKIFSATDSRTLEVSWRTLQKVEEQITKSPKVPLSILEVHQHFAEIAGTSGKGSRQRKEELLTDLLSRVSPIEKKYLVKMIFGEMQHGVAEGVMQQGIAEATGSELALVHRAALLLGDIAEVARLGLTKGKKAFETIALQLMRPIQPMLAELAEDFDEVFKEHGNQTALEYKFDGARVQIHCSRKQKTTEVKIFSRHLSEVTSSLPELVEWVQTKIKADSFIVEGEVVAVNAEGKPLPFQELMRRFRRVHHIEETRREVPVRLYLFDLLYLNGQSFIDQPYRARWQKLTEICDKSLLADRLVTRDMKAAEQFLQQAMQAGHEGLMAKDLLSTYQPGSRGKKWFKIKPAETLDVVIVAADWGYGRRTGWLSNYHLAVRDSETGEFLVIGKTFKGLTDEEFKWMTAELQKLKTSETNYTVQVRPQIVVEVAYNEIQRSPQYPSQFALRFARIKRIRTDKTPEQADTIERLQQLYEQQFERKGEVTRARQKDREAYQ